MRWTRAAVSGLVWGLLVAGCSSAEGSRSADDGSGGVASTPATAAAGQPGADEAVSAPAHALVRTSGDRQVALGAVHEAWRLFAALEEQNVDAAAEHLLRLSYLGDDVSFGPPVEVGSSQSALTEPPATPPDQGSATCDASGCRFEHYLYFGVSPNRLQGTLRLETNAAERTLSVDLIDDDLDAAFALPSHISGSLVATDTSLGGGLSVVIPFDEGEETQIIGFSELTFEPGVALPSATPLSGYVIGAWASWQYPTQLALIAFP